MPYLTGESIPAETVCGRLYIPADPQIIANVIGALRALTQTYNWEAFGATSVPDTIAAMKAMINFFEDDTCASCSHQGDELEDCMRLRVKPDDPCIIEQECTPGEWETWYDPRECMTDLVRDGSTQPDPSGEIAPDGHYSQCPTLDGNGQYIFPKLVLPGDVITVTDAKGGWMNGGGSYIGWFCPSGQNYALGACFVEAPPAGVGFPMPTKPPMRLIARYAGEFYDAYNTTFTINPAVGVSDLVFFANDPDLTNNAGSITFCVDVLHPASHAEDFSEFDWQITIDMENIDYSWLIQVSTANGNAPNGYVVGTGVQSGLGGNWIAANFRLHLAGGYSEVRAVAAQIYSAEDDPANPEGFFVHTDDNIAARQYYQLKVFTADEWTTLRLDIPAGEVQVSASFNTWIDFEAQGGVGGGANNPNTIIRKLFLAGSGTMPGLVHS